MDEIIAFGEWIRRRRKGLDLTQKELADRVGCAVITIAKIEADERRPSREVALLLAEQLQIPTDRRAAFVRAARGEISAGRLGRPTAPEMAELRPAQPTAAAESARPPAAAREPAEPADAALVRALAERIAAGRLVGRAAELAQAQAAWQQAAAGESRVLIVGGEPGVGKSRLVRELMTDARRQGGLTLIGECYAEGGAPYAPFARILHAQRDWPTGLPGLALADLIAIAPALAGRFPRVRPNPALEPSAERLRLFESVGAFITRLAATAPLLLLLEDLHWADTGTVELAHDLARQLRGSGDRVLIVLTGREAELTGQRGLGELLDDLHRSHQAVYLPLGRLDRAATHDLLAALFDEEFSPEFAGLIYRETEGNPFFIEEVCRDLVESGQVYRADGRWQRKEIQAIRPPRSVRLAVQSRANKLPADTQTLLQAAAVLGQGFELRALAEATGLDEDALTEALEPAERTQLVFQVSPAAGGAFKFSHALVPAALREGLTGLQRRRLNRRALAALEKLHPQEFATLAYHAAEAGETEAALGYYRQAADRARTLYANEDALRLYDRALALAAEGTAVACDLRLARARVHDLRGDREPQLLDLRVAQAVADQLNDAGRRAEATLARAQYAEDTSDYEAAIGLAQEAQALAEQAAALDLQAQVSMLWGRVLTYTGDLDAARGHLLRATELGRACGQSLTETRSLGNLGVLDYRLGNLDAAEAECLQALERARTLGERRIEAVVLINLGNTHWAKGDLDRALRDYEDSLALSREMGHRLNEARGLSNIGSILTEQRRYADARSKLDQARAIFGRLGQRWDERVVLGHLGDVLEGLGQYAASASQRSQARAVAAEIGDQQGEAEMLADLSRTALALGNTAQAQEEAEEALALARASGGRWEEALAWHVLAACRAAAGDDAAAAEAYRAALALHEEMGQAAKRTELHAELAWLARRQGDAATAAAELAHVLPDRTAAAIHKLDNPRLCWLCYQALRDADPATAAAALTHGHQLIQAAAAAIPDAAEREQYLSGIPHHRDLMAAWEGKRRIVQEDDE